MKILRAQHIREVFTYAQKFKNNSFVFYIDSALLRHVYLAGIVKDILYLLEIGVRVSIVIDSEQETKNVLQEYRKSFITKGNSFVFSQEDIALVQMAAFESSLRIINMFAKYNQTATIGNFVRAKGIGVVDGVDFEHTGIVDKVDINAISRLQEDNVIPVFPSIGWSATGKSYYLDAVSLASHISQKAHAHKLFFLVSYSPDILLKGVEIKANNTIDISDDGRICRITREGLTSLLSHFKKEQQYEDYRILAQSVQALSHGIERVHILNGEVDGCLLEEMFSNVGIGLMLHADEYQEISPLQEKDIEEVYMLMRPLVSAGILVERTMSTLKQTYQDYVVYKVDSVIYGLAALHELDKESVEIAAVLVKENYNKNGVGRKIIQYFLDKSKDRGYQKVFTFTKNTGDWFETLGFTQTEKSLLPQKRKELYETQKRGSRIYLFTL